MFNFALDRFVETYLAFIKKDRSMGYCCGKTYSQLIVMLDKLIRSGLSTLK